MTTYTAISYEWHCMLCNNMTALLKLLEKNISAIQHNRFDFIHSLVLEFRRCQGDEADEEFTG